jgi:hypothetical protein
MRVHSLSPWVDITRDGIGFYPVLLNEMEPRLPSHVIEFEFEVGSYNYEFNNIDVEIVEVKQGKPRFKYREDGTESDDLILVAISHPKSKFLNYQIEKKFAPTYFTRVVTPKCETFNFLVIFESQKEVRFRILNPDIKTVLDYGFHWDGEDILDFTCSKTVLKDYGLDE